MPEKLPNLTDNFALNFVNSRIVRHDKIKELIRSIEDLKKWTELPNENNIEYNTQLSILSSFLDEEIDIKDLIVFRDSIHASLREMALGEKQIIEIKEEIESFMETHSFTLVFVENIPLFIPTDNGVEGIKTLIYLSLSELIRTEEINKLSCCANEQCLNLFINQSGRRKWCSMKICGNRNKVGRFGEKKKNC